MRVEYAELSLVGGRELNQDRVSAAVAEHAALAIVCDGMGGHSGGERAAELALQAIGERFWHTAMPILDPTGFLHLTLGSAHQRVVAIGNGTPIDARPRSTCALCLVQNDSVYFAHVGDSRVYHMRRGKLVSRTRDHSHVELLAREGLLRPEQVHNHPMRNFVESCLGGESLLPEMTVSGRSALVAGDVLLACTDGLWGSLPEEELLKAFAPLDAPLQPTLEALGERAVTSGGPASDNTSAVVFRCLEPDA